MNGDLWIGLAPLFGLLGLPVGFGAYVFADRRDFQWWTKVGLVGLAALVYGAVILVIGLIVMGS